MDQQTTPKSAKTITLPSTKALVGAAVVVVIGAAGFFGGVQYQKRHQPKNTGTMATGQFGTGGFGGRGGMRRGAGLGQVTSVSNSSITVKNERTGVSKTYSITSATTVMNGTAAGSAGDIKTGDSVIVTATSASATEAGRIVVNPTMSPSASQQSDDSFDGESAPTFTN
jgi:hypothetical protein